MKVTIPRVNFIFNVPDINILPVISVHVVVIAGMLVHFDKYKTKDGDPSPITSPIASTQAAPGNTIPAPQPAAPPAPIDVRPVANPGLSATSLGAPVSADPAPQPTSSANLVPYVIVKGDTLVAIARKNGLSLKALEEANPNINATKLRIGQELQIPASPDALAETGATPGTAADATSANGAVYVVKSGDILLKIAKANATTVKNIMDMNDLKSTSIRCGQKLKIPSPQILPPTPPVPLGTAITTTPLVSGQIIKVPSKEELDKGAKIEVITNVPNSQ